jgi:membrane-associated phospholipid phosphatase
MTALPLPDDWEAIRRFDESVDRAFDHLRGHKAIDRLMYAASELGDFSLIWHLVGAAQGLRSERHLARAVRLAVALGAESALVNVGIKSLFRRERPVHDAARPHRLRQPKTSSFPSGHASAAACATVLLVERDQLCLLWVATALIVGTSRVHVRIHHASDVVAGAAIGAAFGLTVRKLWPLPA